MQSMQQASMQCSVADVSWKQPSDSSINHVQTSVDHVQNGQVHCTLTVQTCKPHQHQLLEICSSNLLPLQ